ncbi:glycosyltransferase family 4 protein [Colwellia sp. 1_MG-2023]|uniref:glycosyltransferase family 4 protein n=1 Tax=Colwellia sp. 1_MG-2023 TaxID=3062649 RepID=UPI0026E17DF6|nr:glycosyltransferase family 4 protein [Colwellia sp. 1_MG-2023]MDO6445479.1 glycosyltransferase family 4 protein [Colwellia sp. 1_MG-2023]
MSKIAFITAAPETISAFLLAYIKALAEHHDIHIITSLKNGQSIRGLDSKIIVHNVNIHRDPKVFSDVKSLVTLYRLFRKERYELVHSFTPKAGLLTQISAFMARVPKRLHTFTGQVWATKQGTARVFLKFLDSITAKLATYCLIDSPSQKAFLLKEELLTDEQCSVLASGSISGVNIEKYNFSQENRNQLRAKHHIADDDFVFMFVGRLKKEKGVPELLAAFKQINQNNKVKLFILGSDEENLSEQLNAINNLHYLGFIPNTEDYYSFADVLCLPSHREGFGNVIIEAASCQLPALASNIYGLSDAVEHNGSGILHPVKDEQAIATAMQSLIDNPEKLTEMRKRCRARIEETFDEKILVNEFMHFYQTLGLK